MEGIAFFFSSSTKRMKAGLTTHLFRKGTLKGHYRSTEEAKRGKYINQSGRRETVVWWKGNMMGIPGQQRGAERGTLEPHTSQRWGSPGYLACDILSAINTL